MLTMAQKDYLSQLLDNMQEQLNRLEKKQDRQTNTIEKIHLQTQKTNGRVTETEKEIKDIQKAMNVKAGWAVPDSKTLYVIGLAALVLLVIIARVVGADIESLLGL